jgi:quinol monooxygenase YgiN
MFARVITAQAGPDGIEGVVRLAEQQLAGAREMPGFAGYYLLNDAETGKVLIVSLWTSQAEMDAVTAGSGGDGIRDEGVAATGLTGLELATYDVVLHE